MAAGPSSPRACRAPAGRSRAPHRDRGSRSRGLDRVPGTLVSGGWRKRPNLRCCRGRHGKARGFQVHGQSTGVARGAPGRGERGGVDVRTRRGGTAVAGRTVEPTSRVDVVIDLLPDAPALRHGARIRFHQGTTEALGRVALAQIREPEDSATGGFRLQAEELRTRASEVAPGGSAYARIRFEGTAVLTRGENRYHPRPIAGSRSAAGLCSDPQHAVSNSPPAATSAFGALTSSDPSTAHARAVLAFIEERGTAGLPRAALVTRAGLAPSDAGALEHALTAAASAVRIEGFLVSPLVVDDVSRKLLRAVGAHHTAQPLSEGLPREEARERLFARAAPPLFEHVVTRLAAAGKLGGNGSRLALAGHQLSLSPEEVHAREVLERLFREGGLGPPDLGVVGASAGLAPAVVERVALLLVRQKTLIKVDALFFHAAALAGLKDDVMALKGEGGTAARVDVAAFKARYGISRKYAIPLLEYLDRERITRRVGDSRVVL